MRAKENLTTFGIIRESKRDVDVDNCVNYLTGFCRDHLDDSDRLDFGDDLEVGVDLVGVEGCHLFLKRFVWMR